MEKVCLRIPYAVPLMGESFVDVGAPLMTTALDFSWSVTLERAASERLDIPLRSPHLKGVLTRFLSSQGIEGSYSIRGHHAGSPDQDFVNAAALLYLTDCEAIESELPALLEDSDAGTFVTTTRALTSLSGGVVVGRRGEGFLSVRTALKCPICLRILEAPVFHEGAVRRFSKAFPEISDALWHVVSHLVLRGIGAVQAGDLEKLGSAISLETSLLFAVGSLSLSDLQRISAPPSRGKKVVLLPGLTADMIIPMGHECPSEFQRMEMSMEGVSEIEG